MQWRPASVSVATTPCDAVDHLPTFRTLLSTTIGHHFQLLILRRLRLRAC